MKKCLTCVWADFRSGTKIFCPFPSCVKRNPEPENEIVKEAEKTDKLKEDVNIDEGP